MKTQQILTSGAVLLFAITACSPEAGKQQSTRAENASAGAAAQSSEPQHGKGEGTITAIDVEGIAWKVRQTTLRANNR